MTQEQLVKMALAYAGTTLSAISKELGASTQNFSQRLKRGSLTDEELLKIAEIIDAKFIPCRFEFPDGTKI